MRVKRVCAHSAPLRRLPVAVATAVLLAALLFACPRPVHAAEFDLLGALSLQNTTWKGLSTTVGPEPMRLAITLGGENRDIQLPSAAYSKAADLLRKSSEFTFLAALRQDQANSGAILSFSHGANRYLELQSSARRNEIRLHYLPVGSENTRMETFPYRLADGTWHHLAVTVSGTQIQVRVDCHELYKHSIALPDTNFSIPQLTLWLGQRSNKTHFMFKGSLQNVKIVSGPHGYLSQCPDLNPECPTCGEFALLEANVRELTATNHQLSSMYIELEKRISKVEQCDCTKSCFFNNSIRADGETWKKDCNLCSCVHGKITCRPVECPLIECKNPVHRSDECCPKCNCYSKGIFYEHGEVTPLRQCVVCECKDGILNCSTINPVEQCPSLTCSELEQFVVSGECCKFCPGVDYCNLGHRCSKNATCMNLNTKYTCKCNQGFDGDGITCNDVDECSSPGGLWGHHCHLHTHCTNVVGSYVCECDEGYARSDKYNCVEIDECVSGDHRCSPFAHCINTAGSYSCQCMQGYRGDGYTCKPICSKGCLNAGTCQLPEKCECRPGFTGQHCERDLDECTTNSHHCPSTAICVNMPGWYYCKCKSGYRSMFHGDAQTTTCQDIDECKEGLHTCHPSAQCENTDGSFRCLCSQRNQSDCKLSCMHGSEEIPHGREWIEKCNLCTCKEGILSCSAAPCVCSSHPAAVTSRGPRLSRDCCPQCDARNDCHHQELHHVIFHSGERWVYQCQTCECLLGEIDCWELECPVGDYSVGERACCGVGGKVTGVHAVEALCSPNSPTPCPQAAHHTAPDCQMAYCATLVSNNACCVHR